jgi:exopolyphosphatase/pppGpp-phosphohydrolase
LPTADKVAAIDIGTNSVLLVIAAADAGAARPLLERATITRMGEGVDQTRKLAPAAIERNLACRGSTSSARAPCATLRAPRSS